MRLYSFSHSSASYRVRIAMALKGLNYELIPIDLRNNEHNDEKYMAINPHRRIPLLVDGDFSLSQSLAIIDYLEEKFEEPSIYPRDIQDRALCRAFSHTIASDVFPLQNLGVRQKLGRDFEQSETEQSQWCAYWIENGFKSLEQILSQNPPKTEYLFAEYPTLADICLVPQMNNARRFGVDLDKYSILCEFDSRARNHAAFISSAPENVK